MTCTAQTKAGRRCRRRPLEGREVCHAHSGAKVGRPRALTPEVHGRIVQFVKAGCPGSIAARAAGISESTFYEILRVGRESQSGPERELLDALEQARAEAYGHAMIALRRDIGTPGNYRAALAYIDRFDRGRFPLKRPSSEASSDRERGDERRLDLAGLSDDQLAMLETLYADADGVGEGER